MNTKKLVASPVSSKNSQLVISRLETKQYWLEPMLRYHQLLRFSKIRILNLEWLLIANPELEQVAGTRSKFLLFTLQRDWSGR